QRRELEHVAFVTGELAFAAQRERIITASDGGAGGVASDVGLMLQNSLHYFLSLATAGGTLNAEILRAGGSKANAGDNLRLGAVSITVKQVVFAGDGVSRTARMGSGLRLLHVVKESVQVGRGPIAGPAQRAGEKRCD